jgi:hypothetical protein
VKKAALVQAKLLKGSGSIRSLKLKTTSKAARLGKQCQDMQMLIGVSVAMFYTQYQVYIVDASHYAAEASRDPLLANHRLVTLGTYLGKWLPRCTKGDLSGELISRVE